MIHDEATSSNEAHAKFKKVQQGVENEGYYFSKKERNVQLIKVCTSTSNWCRLMFHFKFDLYLKFRTKDFLNM